MRWRPVVVAAVLVAVVVAGRLTVCDPARVSSGSMAPTVCTGDVVIVDHLAPHGHLRVGDIVTFPSPITEPSKSSGWSRWPGRASRSPTPY